MSFLIRIRNPSHECFDNCFNISQYNLKLRNFKWRSISTFRGQNCPLKIRAIMFNQSLSVFFKTKLLFNSFFFLNSLSRKQLNIKCKQKCISVCSLILLLDSLSFFFLNFNYYKKWVVLSVARNWLCNSLNHKTVLTTFKCFIRMSRLLCIITSTAVLVFVHKYD